MSNQKSNERNHHINAPKTQVGVNVINDESIHMIEFFSGIGGFRYGVMNAIRRRSSPSRRRCHKATTVSTVMTTLSTELQIHPFNDDETINNDTTTDDTRQQQPYYRLSSCTAYDISIHANNTYKHNFCTSTKNNNNNDDKEEPRHLTELTSSQVKTKLIEQLKISDLDGMANLWTLSPPCQPFTSTKNAKRRDKSDKRTYGFQHLIQNILPQLTNKPRWIVLENVKGFYDSEVHCDWCACLKDCGYTYRDCLMSPVDLGIPNNRTRYFMICELSQRFAGCCLDGDDHRRLSLGNRWRREEVEGCDDVGLIDTTENGDTPVVVGGVIGDGSSSSEGENHPKVVHNGGHDNNEDPSTTGDNTSAIVKKRPLHDYIQHDLPLNKPLLSQYLLSDEQLRHDWASHLSIVTPADTITYCFTAGYSRILHRATGSVLLYDQKESIDVKPIVDREHMIRYAGRIRKFTPRELLRLFGFPEEFEFPEDKGVSLEHQYKLIGNAVNVCVVTTLMEELFYGTR